MCTLPDFPPLINDNILRMAWGKPAKRLPIWIMRQAGRYLPEFQKLREKHSFFEICQTPELACEATLLPIRRYDLDAAIIFSDILVIPQALGMVVEMRPGVGPVLPEPLTLNNIDKLQQDGAVARLKYVGDAITLTRTKLEGKVPLFGFSGAPWTLMVYMIEGGGSKTCSKAKRWLYAHPMEAHKLLLLLTEVIVDYLVMQIEAGAQIVQVFDSSAEYLNKELFNTFSLDYLKRIRESVEKKLNDKHIEPVPMVVFAKGAHHSLAELGDCGYQIVGIDWTIEPKLATDVLRNKNVTCQGNLDPCALYAPADALEKTIRKMIDSFGNDRYIVNLGHGIYPDVDPEAVKTFIDCVHNYKS